MSEYAKALLEAQRAVTAIGHDGQNQHQRYKYTSAEMLIGVCGQALNNAGLLIVRESCAVSEWVDDIANVASVFMVTHAESGQERSYTFEMPAVIQKGRPPDKAVSGALTASSGYFMRDLLNVSRGHDEYDINRRNDEDDQPPSAKRRPPPMNPGAFIDAIDAMGIPSNALNAYRDAHGKGPLSSESDGFHLRQVFINLQNGEARAVQDWMAEQ